MLCGQLHALFLLYCIVYIAENSYSFGLILLCLKLSHVDWGEVRSYLPTLVIGRATGHRTPFLQVPSTILLSSMEPKPKPEFIFQAGFRIPDIYKVTHNESRRWRLRLRFSQQYKVQGPHIIIYAVKGNSSRGLGRTEDPFAVLISRLTLVIF